jgi:copper(I)-binding protein
MLFDLNKSFKVGETYTVDLDFERAGKMRVPVTVKAAGGADHHHH